MASAGEDHAVPIDVVHADKTSDESDRSNGPTAIAVAKFENVLLKSGFYRMKVDADDRWVHVVITSTSVFENKTIEAAHIGIKISGSNGFSRTGLSAIMVCDLENAIDYCADYMKAVFIGSEENFKKDDADMAFLRGD